MSKEFFTDSIVSDTSRNSAATLVSNSSLSEAAEALTVLGYDKNTVLNALKGIDPSVKDVGEIIKLALKKLAR